MLGAIAGDLAAWTYENDRDRFYSSLTSKDAILSSLGRVAFDAAIWSMERGETEIFKIEFKIGHNPLRNADQLMVCTALAWSNRNPFLMIDAEHDLFYDDKEGMYAGLTIVELIQKLKAGKTKIEALDDGKGETFKQLKSGWPWKENHVDEGLYIYLMRAWDCFERSWDFTSAIHNAARWENADRHLLCCLTGTLAEAMYGCEYRLLKKQYGGNGYCYIEYPDNLAYDVKRIHDFQFKNRTFFPKNSALTNVENHIWRPYHSRFDEMKLSAEKRSLLLRAFYTGWDNRYGFYLDNGWVYTYRSGVLIVRFKISPTSDLYILSDFQSAEKDADLADIAIDEALSCLEQYDV